MDEKGEVEASSAELLLNGLESELEQACIVAYMIKIFFHIFPCNR